MQMGRSSCLKMPDAHLPIAPMFVPSFIVRDFFLHNHSHCQIDQCDADLCCDIGG